MQKVFTTTQIAKMLQVSNRKITQYIDEGILQGYTLPSSTHRRVVLSKLEDFMKAQNIPLELLDAYLTNASIQEKAVDVVEPNE